MSSERQNLQSNLRVVEAVDGRFASISDIRIEYTENYQKYFAYARILTPSKMNAEDLVQQAFINTVAQIKNDNEILLETLRAYIKNVIRNLSISNHRKYSMHPRLRLIENPELTPDVVHEMDEEKKRVINALTELSNAQRTIIVMNYFDGLKVEEIAEHLGISKSAVKTHLLRGRKHLGKLLDKHVDIEKEA